MNTVNVHEAKTNFSNLLATIEKNNQPIVICRNGKPVADLVPHKRVKRPHPDPLLAQIKIAYDPTETLSEAEWPREAR